jgi:hypothetical protein
MCWTPLYASKLKECIYKTWVLLQTIAVKDEPNIVSMWKSKPISQLATQNVKTHNRKQKIYNKRNKTGGELRCSRIVTSLTAPPCY